VKRGSLLLLAVLVLTGLLAALLLGGHAEAEGSALSHGPAGWLAARRYLEARDCAVTLLDRPLKEAPVSGVLVLTLPWQVVEFDPGAGAALDAHLAKGGTILLAVTDHALAAGQDRLLGALDLTWREVRGRPPLLPWRWREFASRQWMLAGGDTEPRPVEIAAPRGVVEAPAGADVLWRGEDRVPVVFAYRRKGGRVVVVPAGAFANGRLSRAGNADLLEQLRVWLGDAWTFDEYHHGLIAPATVDAPRTAHFLDLFLLHLGLVYVLALVALARRFGPAWAEPSVISGSTAGFLIGLGGLHHRNRHHAAAARLLVERACELDPRLLASPPAADAVDGAALVALGKDVAQAQRLKGGKR
jgi:hypothetical protein